MGSWADSGRHDDSKDCARLASPESPFMKLLKLCRILLLVHVAAACCSCGGQGATRGEGTYEEKEMEAAKGRARSEVDSFLAAWKEKKGQDFSVKVLVEDQGKTEPFWLTDVTYEGGEFVGKIGNDPGIVSNVSFGQKWTIKKEKISDWMFMRDGKLHGNYTMRPLLKTLPKEEADKMRSILAEP
jgi:uncharacterized protein YegJ (DUF2314 family)